MLTPGTREFTALVNTQQVAVFGVAIQMAIGFLIAQQLVETNRFNCIMRVVVVLPLLVPPVIAAVLWNTILTDRGVANCLLDAIGIGSIHWFGSVDTAMWSIIMIDTWIYTPFVILIFLAGLQSIPSEILEASRVDGHSLCVVGHVLCAGILPAAQAPQRGRTCVRASVFSAGSLSVSTPCSPLGRI